MKNTLLLFFAFVFGGMAVWAAPVTPYQAKVVAQNFLRFGKNIPNATVTQVALGQSSQMADKTVGIQTLWYVFGLDQSAGFVIVSADDRFEPILGYSTESNYQSENLPEHIQGWFAEIRNEMEFYLKANIKKNATTTKVWETWIYAAEPIGGAENYVAPLIQSKWSQGNPYNAYCPVSFTGSRGLTGCVATAMAQLMRYWKYPDFGKGSHSWAPPLTSTLTANFGLSYYDWQNMALVNPPTPSNAIAQIMYHAGIAVNMTYSPDFGFSFAEVSGVLCVTQCGNTAEDALKNYFRYDPSMVGRLKSAYSNSAWSNLLKSELNAGRPVLYAAMDDNNPVFGGHCFLIDGYDAYGKFSINWGWGGALNGYFALNAFNTSNGSYNSGQHAVFGIKPIAASSCGMPTGCTSTNVTNTSATISWNAVLGATGYYAQARPLNSSTWTHMGFLTGTTANATNLLPNITYEWQVRAECGKALGTPSHLVQFTTGGTGGGTQSNDQICNATWLTPASSCVSVAGSNTNATTSGASYICGDFVSSDVWYTTTIPSTGIAAFRTNAGTLTDAVMAVYYGNDCNNPTYLGCVNDMGNGSKMPVLGVSGTVGTRIWVRIWGYGAQKGTFSICALNYSTFNKLGDNAAPTSLELLEIPEKADPNAQVFFAEHNIHDAQEPIDNFKSFKVDSFQINERNIWGKMTLDAFVYPNPAGDHTTMRFNAAVDGPMHLALLDAFGRLLQEQHHIASVGENSVQLDLNGLPNGVYIARISFNGAVLAFPFNKQQ